MEDCGSGSRTLKDLLVEHPNALSPDRAQELGSALGEFIRIVHDEGTEDKDLMNLVSKNVEMRKLTAWVTYGRLMDTLTDRETGKRPAAVFNPPLNLPSEDLETIQELVTQAVDDITHSSTSFTMGDFWTGNAIVQTAEPTDATSSDSLSIKRVFVVDWEFCKPGLAYLDVAQFAAEMHTARTFYKGPDGRSAVDEALPAFFRAYNARGALSVEDVKRTAVHIGAHLAVVTPAVSTWSPKETVRELVEVAVEYLLRGRRGDLDWLNSSIVNVLLEA